MDWEKYKVELNGEVTYVSPYLIKSRNISDDVVEQLKESHVERLRIFQEARATTDVPTLQRLAAEFEKLEFRQQALWGFPQSSDFHRWFEFPGCDCPKMDNEDRLGTSYRVISETCVIHGNKQ